MKQRWNRQRQDHEVAVGQTGGISTHRSDQSPLHRPFRSGRSVNQTLHLDSLGEQVQTDRSTDQAETDDANAARIHTHAAPRS